MGNIRFGKVPLPPGICGLEEKRLSVTVNVHHRRLSLGKGSGIRGLKE